MVQGAKALNCGSLTLMLTRVATVGAPPARRAGTSAVTRAFGAEDGWGKPSPAWPAVAFREGGDPPAASTQVSSGYKRPTIKLASWFAPRWCFGWQDPQYHMPVEDFRTRATPESRMHRVLVVLFIIGGIRAVFGVFVGSRYSVETAIGVFVVAIAYAVWRYLRQPHDPSGRQISN
jgi:hypothetical protein